jgi:hypothetical protein
MMQPDLSGALFAIFIKKIVKKRERKAEIAAQIILIEII